MKDLAKEFENKSINYDKLIKYGFIKQKNHYFFEKRILNHFKVWVDISKDQQVSKIFDLDMDEEYILVDVCEKVGSFSGKVREEYNAILEDIIKKCTSTSIFKSNQAKQVMEYIRETYQDEAEYLWKKFPENAIWRHSENKKWYGLIMTISKQKLGYQEEEPIEILVLKYPKEKISTIVDNKKIFLGYHMNKEHWITIPLDGRMAIKEIYQFIQISYKTGF